MSPSAPDLHRGGHCLSEGVVRHLPDQKRKKMPRLPDRGRALPPLITTVPGSFFHRLLDSFPLFEPAFVERGCRWDPLTGRHDTPILTPPRSRPPNPQSDHMPAAPPRCRIVPGAGADPGPAPPVIVQGSR